MTYTSKANVESVKAKDIKVGDIVQFGNCVVGFEFETIVVAQPSLKRTRTDIGWAASGDSINVGNQTNFYRVVSWVVGA
jgi:hypothetical protein